MTYAFLLYPCQCNAIASRFCSWLIAGTVMTLTSRWREAEVTPKEMGGATFDVRGGEAHRTRHAHAQPVGQRLHAL